MTRTAEEIRERIRQIDVEVDRMEHLREAERRDFTPEESTMIDRRLDERDRLREERHALELGEQRTKATSARMRAHLETVNADEQRTEAIIARVRASRMAAKADPDFQRMTRQFSMFRAANSMIERRRLDGVEAEVSQELAHQMGRSPRGFFVPLDAGSGERRDVTTSAASGLVETNLRAVSLFHRLRSRMVLAALGASVLPDVVGHLNVPKITSGSGAFWVDEGGVPTSSAPTVGQVTFTPSTVGAFSVCTRQLLTQAGGTAQQISRAQSILLSDMARSIAAEVDRVGLNGSGDDPEPLGLLPNDDVPTIAMGTNGGPMTHAKLCDLEQSIGGADADVNTLGFVTSSLGRSRLRQTPKATDHPVYLWGDDNRVLGYQALATNSIPTNLEKGTGENLTAALLGDFSALFIAFWGAVDVIVDPFILSTSGRVRITSLLDVALKVRHPEAFAKVIDLATAA